MMVDHIVQGNHPPSCNIRNLSLFYSVAKPLNSKGDRYIHFVLPHSIDYLSIYSMGGKRKECNQANGNCKTVFFSLLLGLMYPDRLSQQGCCSYTLQEDTHIIHRAYGRIQYGFGCNFQRGMTIPLYREGGIMAEK